jgi:hypothetical protein
MVMWGGAEISSINLIRQIEMIGRIRVGEG